MAMRSALPTVVLLVSLLIGLVSLLLEQPRSLLSNSLESFWNRTPFGSAIAHDAFRNVTYVGTSTVAGVEHFQNIFFAEDTSGDNRFAPPVPIVPEAGSRIDAAMPGAWCPQARQQLTPFTTPVENISENCLSLRIARPRRLAHTAKLPVMVYIHGGGQCLGSTFDKLYTPDGLVEQSMADGQPVIYVGINYRLGFFGFALNDALISEKHANIALRDQRAAFEWVRDNIAAFGGDPKRITAFGESAGAINIGLHLTSFGGRAPLPFQRAMLMSGSPGLTLYAKTDLVKNSTISVASQLDCLDESQSAQSMHTIDCLRNVPMERLMNVSLTIAEAANPPHGEIFFNAAWDGDFVTDRPTLLSRAGAMAKGIPLILSWVTDDGSMFVPPSVKTEGEVEAALRNWFYGVSTKSMSKLLDLYPVQHFESKAHAQPSISPQYYRAAQILRDLLFSCPSIEFGWQSAKHGSAVRLYVLNQTRFNPIYEKMGTSMWGVSHISDVPYVLNQRHVDAGADNSEAQLALARVMSRSIISFANGADFELDDNAADDWPLAFDAPDLRESHPSKVGMRLFGGPHGNAPVSVGFDTQLSEASAGERAIADEKLLERCAFINSPGFQSETGG